MYLVFPESEKILHFIWRYESEFRHFQEQTSLSGPKIISPTGTRTLSVSKE